MTVLFNISNDIAIAKQRGWLDQKAAEKYE